MDKSCENCKYQHLSEDDSPCNECTHCYTSEWQPQTNADRIRAMSDEKLAENTVQYDYEFQRYICGDGEEFYLRSNAIEHQIEWLKSPIE